MSDRITKLVAISISLVIVLCGCASWVAKPTPVVLLPEERIFSIPAGQPMKVTLDKKPIDITFPYDMKLVSPTVLVRQEEKLNNALLDKIKATASKNKIMTIVTIILGILGSLFGIAFFKKVKWPTFKVNAEVK